MNTQQMHTPNGTQDNIEKLAALFPGCVTEAWDDKNGAIKRAIDFDLLRHELGDVIVDGPRERYQLDWPGKREALQAANAPTAKMLRPCRDDSVHFDTTQNIFIEGDNLDALKLLQETYVGRVKLIYIDPPYNTGKAFVYADDFVADRRAYLIKSQQTGTGEGPLVLNPESNGRFHSDWLSMMLPRLKLARNLLHRDGAIFVSIGVEELANLRLCMSEVFGEGNFVEVFSWIKTATPPGLSRKSRKTTEYIVCFEREKSGIKYFGDVLDGGDQPLLNRGNSVAVLKFPCESVTFSRSVFPDGPIMAHRVERVELMDNILLHNGMADRPFRLKAEFKWSQAFLDAEIRKGTKLIIKSEQLSVRFLRTEVGAKRPTNLIRQETLLKVIDKPTAGVETNEAASAALAALLGGDYFDHPKPVSLIAYLCRFLTGGSDIIMDFFAGSGATAHAVMSLNLQDGGQRSWILVQIPEALGVAATVETAAKKRLQRCIEFLDALGRPRNLAEITKERLRRAGAALQSENTARARNLDVGFRVLQIDDARGEGGLTQQPR